MPTDQPPTSRPSGRPTRCPPDLLELAAAHGVSTDFWDWQGRHCPVSRESVEAVLAALGVAAHTDESVRASLADVRDPAVAAGAAAVRRHPVRAAGPGPGARAARRAGGGVGRARGRRPGRPRRRPTGGSSRARSTAPWWARRRSTCPPTCRSAGTRWPPPSGIEPPRGVRSRSW